jgi:hypothetical protein
VRAQRGSRGDEGSVRLRLLLQRLTEELSLLRRLPRLELNPLLRIVVRHLFDCLINNLILNIILLDIF